MIILSIVVPVYKVEQYIERCISSIINNSLFCSHCELIVVDDGSPDMSMLIVERLCALLPNVTLVYQNNQGLGNARNSGESRAVGEYIWFIDSDDWLTSGAIKKILELIEDVGPQIINIDYIMSDGSRTTVKNNALPGLVYKGFDYLNLSFVQNPVQYYIFESKFYRGRRLSFHQGVYHEDALFTPIALALSSKVIRLAEDCYVYNIREGSIMTSGNNLKHVSDMLLIVKKLDEFRVLYTENIWQSHVISRYIALAVGGVFYYWRKLSNSERNSIQELINFRSMLHPIFLSGLFKYLLALIIMQLHYSFNRSAK